MVDYIKFDVPLFYLRTLINNAKIKFRGSYDYTTGEVYDYPIIGIYENFSIKINKRKIIVYGSIHRYYNRKFKGTDHNFNDFSFGEFVLATSNLSKELELPPDQLKLENVEIGVNVKVSFNVNEMLTGLIIDWNGKPKHVDKTYKNGHMVEFKTSETYKKYYDKGRQNYLPYELIRVEEKHMRNDVLFKKAGVKTLSDLTIKKNFDRLVNDFNRQVLKVNIVDNIHTQVQLKPKDLELFKNGINSGFWSTYKDHGHIIRFGTYRTKYFKLVKSLGLNKQKQELTQAIFAKIEEMCKNES